jgi:hypothetical protein
LSDEQFESGKNSFTIGTPATGGAIKVYFTDEQDAVNKMNLAIKLYSQAQTYKQVTQK